VLVEAALEAPACGDAVLAAPQPESRTITTPVTVNARHLHKPLD
jgi:hypothetical protein